MGVWIQMWRDFAQGIPVACWAALTDAAFKPMPRVQGRVAPYGRHDGTGLTGRLTRPMA